MRCHFIGISRDFLFARRFREAGDQVIACDSVYGGTVKLS